MQRQLGLAFIALLVCETILAACPTNMEGNSKEFDIVIHQDCGIRSEIQVRKWDKKSKEPTVLYQRAFLDTECQFTKTESMMLCRKNGKTILAGTGYKLTNDSSPQCPDASFGLRYTCIKGCTKSIPKYLSVNPYEC